MEKIAKIKNVTLGFEDHGIFTCVLDLDYGGSGQGAGLHGLDGWDKEKKERYSPDGLLYKYLTGIMRATGSRNWENVKGKTVIAITDSESDWDGKVIGLKQLPPDGDGEFMFADAFEGTVDD